MLSKLAYLAAAVAFALTLGAPMPSAAVGDVALTERANPIPAPADGCLLGAYIHDNPDQSVFDNGAGKNHALLLKFIHMGVDSFDVTGPISARAFCDSAYALDAVPYLTIEPDHATAESVLTAEDRVWLTDFAKELGAYQRPALVRFGHEMNGNWYPWGWTHVSPEVYIEGFREAAAIFREHAPLVAMVWAPSQNWGNNCTELYSTWYPGDEYVDWVGLTSYEWSYGGVMDGQFYYSIKFGDGPEGNFYATFAEGHNKPMMIAETGCGDDDPAYYARQEQIDTFGTGVGQGAQNWWIARVYDASDEYYSTKRNFPKIGAITWFGKGDWAPGGSDLALHSTGFSAYANAVADPYWRSNAMLPPETEVVGVPTGWSRSDVSVTFRVPRPGSSGGIRTLYGIDAPATAEWTAPVTISAEGVTTLYFRSVGRAGAWEDTRSAQVSIDKTPPVTGDDHLDEYLAPATISLVAHDAHSGVALTRFSLDGGTQKVGVRVSDVGPGTHSLEYWSVDGAGNEEAHRTVTFRVAGDTAPAPAPVPVELKLMAPPGNPIAGARSTLTGVLREASGAPIVFAPVQLQRRSQGEWRTFASGVTNAAGTCAFAVSPTARTAYRLLFAGATSKYVAGLSPVVTVTPKPAIGRPLVPKRCVAGRRVVVEGMLTPNHASGTRVRLYVYKRVGRSWKRRSSVSVKLATVRGRSRYRAHVRLPSKGSWRVRVFAPADEGHAAAWSARSRAITAR